MMNGSDGDDSRPGDGDDTHTQDGQREDESPRQDTEGQSERGGPSDRPGEESTHGMTADETTPAFGSQSTSEPPVAQHQSAEDVDETMLLVRDVLTSVIAVFLIGAYLFAISGVWPPMVAIESGSMEPNMDINDLVFVMDADRFQPDAAQGDTGVVTAQRGEEVDYAKFDDYGDVIVFEPGGQGEQTPIIHRAMFWVDEGENWCERANPEYLGGLNPSNRACEAPHAGFITKGDKNNVYDQTRQGVPVKSEWIVGTAERRIPGLGWLRLQFQ